MRVLPKNTFKKVLRMSLLNILQNEDDYIQIPVIIKKVGVGFFFVTNQVLRKLCFSTYSPTSIIRTSIIRISRLSGLFLSSQFCNEYSLVMIKIRSHVLFKTTALKTAVKSEFGLLSKSKIMQLRRMMELSVRK